MSILAGHAFVTESNVVHKRFVICADKRERGNAFALGSKHDGGQIVVVVVAKLVGPVAVWPTTAECKTDVAFTAFAIEQIPRDWIRAMIHQSRVANISVGILHFDVKLPQTTFPR